MNRLKHELAALVEEERAVLDQQVQGARAPDVRALPRALDQARRAFRVPTPRRRADAPPTRPARAPAAESERTSLEGRRASLAATAQELEGNLRRLEDQLAEVRRCADVTRAGPGGTRPARLPRAACLLPRR